MEAEVLNISPLVVWVIALSQLLTFGLTVWNLLASGGRANTARLAQHDDALNVHDRRIAAIEQVQRAGPSKNDLHKLELAMEQLKGEMRAMGQAMAGNAAIMERLEAIVGRHEAHLLEGGRR